jgi:hypothetical protein
MSKRRNRPEDIWRFVDKMSSSKGCWLWIGHRNKHGYGQFKQHYRTVQVHRIAWELTYGSIPLDKMVCHSCHVPPCINPDHLYLGTAKQNSEDMVNNGRWKGNQILTREQVEIIRVKLSEGESVGTVAIQYGIGQGAIYNIRSGVNWSK